MLEPLKVALIGVGGGIGGKHVSAMKEFEKQGLVKLVAVADSDHTKNRVVLHDLSDSGVAIYKDSGRMLEVHSIDALTISAPHHYHVPLSVEALNKGIDVFCEKPPAVTVASG